MRLRRPTAEDAAAVWRLVRDSESLDLNSPYAYLLLCSHFRATCLLAEHDGRVDGAVLGYSPPERPSSYFVWQVAVAPEARGRGLARQLLVGALATSRPHPRWLEATVTPDNDASLALFGSVARCLDAELERTPLFPADLFPGSHQDEHQIRIGPLAPHAVGELADRTCEAALPAPGAASPSSRHSPISTGDRQ